MMQQYRSRRTMLYVPAHIGKHIEKARHLPADSIIFDLQESVPLSEKERARTVLSQHLQNSDFGYSEKVVRINPLRTELGLQDLQVVAQLDVDAIMFPRVESAAEVINCIQQLDEAGGTDKRVIVNIESPLGVLRAQEIAASSERIDAIVMGTTDLATELKLNQTMDRIGLITSLSLVILAARAHNICVVDGPHLDLKNIQACEYSCRQARDLGFDGKTVIHPIQLTYNNDAFTPRTRDVERAKQILVALDDAEKQGRSVAVIDDQLIEPSLHIWALRIINISEQVKKLADWPK
ncbi:MAG: CoA ester lyase [Gammaproteobacteria bacterium CG22_combo_CG10-13_8_21_14_all_40_8]|nr:MAG: CoA ester lyase [Gammaproteobacteria bacterium CG22_combo_CG10-13_8_21_14_all_40_8]